MAFNIDSLLTPDESTRKQMALEPRQQIINEDVRAGLQRHAEDVISPPLAFYFAFYTNLMQLSQCFGSSGLLGRFREPYRREEEEHHEFQEMHANSGNNYENRKARKPDTERKPRQAYTDGQRKILEATFQQCQYLPVNKRVELSETLGLTETQLKNWFQNRRNKWKKEMTSSIRQMNRE